MRMLLAPLARAPAPGGSRVTVQPCSRDPGGEFIQGVSLDDEPFRTGRRGLLNATRNSTPGPHHLASHDRRACSATASALWRLRSLERIGTSTLLATWSAAVYVAQIEDERMTETYHHRLPRVMGDPRPPWRAVVQ